MITTCAWLILYDFGTVFQNHVLSKNPAEHATARDMIAELLTQHHGEYVFRIGAQPPHTELFSGELADTTFGWTGTERTLGEIDEVRGTLERLVDEVGGKVWRFRISCMQFRYSWDRFRSYMNQQTARTLDLPCYYGCHLQMYH